MSWFLLSLLVFSNVVWFVRYRNLEAYARFQASLRHPSAGRSRLRGAEEVR